MFDVDFRPKKNAPSGFSFKPVPGRPVAWVIKDSPASLTKAISINSSVTAVEVDRVRLSVRASSALERVPSSLSSLKTLVWLMCRMSLGVAIGSNPMDPAVAVCQPSQQSPSRSGEAQTRRHAYARQGGVAPNRPALAPTLDKPPPGRR